MTSQQESLPELVRYIQALGVPMLTLAASFIAYMQWRTADQKVQVDLFDKRMQICTYLDNFKKSVRSLKRIYAGDVQKLNDLDIKIRFLFDNKIHESYLQMAFYAEQYFKIFDSIPGYPPPRGFLLLEPANVTMANEIHDLIEEMHFYSRIDRR